MYPKYEREGCRSAVFLLLDSFYGLSPISVSKKNLCRLKTWASVVLQLSFRGYFRANS
jgi:hypothetical protein